MVLPKTSIVFLLLLGCGVGPFVPPKANPIIEDQVGSNSDVFTLGTTADRRLVLVSNRKDGNGNQIDKGLFCAESSPDSIESISSNLGAFVEDNSTEASGDTSQARAQFATALATSAALGTYRSQGLQLFRDSAFMLCQARMNGYITEGQYLSQIVAARQAAYQLILVEIKQDGFYKRVELGQPNELPAINIITPDFGPPSDPEPS